MTKTLIHDESDEKARMIDFKIGAVYDLTRVAQHNQAGVYGQVDSTGYGKTPCQAKEI